MKIENPGVGRPLMGPAIITSGWDIYTYIYGHRDSMTDQVQRAKSVIQIHVERLFLSLAARVHSRLHSRLLSLLPRELSARWGWQ